MLWIVLGLAAVGFVMEFGIRALPFLLAFFFIAIVLGIIVDEIKACLRARRERGEDPRGR